MSEPTTYERLAERFPAEAHKKKPQGNRELTYVTGEMVVSRLNAVLGFDGWSFEVKDITVLDNEVWASGRLTIYSGERTIVREQTGGQIINRNRQGDIVELSNDIKGAVTDCLKKTATLIGVAAYLYDEDERREVEAEMREAKKPTPIKRPTPTPPTQDDKVRAAAMVTGAAPETTRQRWDRMVAEAEAGGLPTLKQVKAIDANVVSEAQLVKYVAQLDTRLGEWARERPA